ncbi:hypothetical protein CEXT_526781 [Caerostris extrusa]|uniref:Uncharacterized protein n=1 Tax=Caerostris extrusa TaxID=172846 RepID=A0AAV4MUZ3_CAEEX|nr:hypothetical protein CEXT_526781 [Caerostris extrusa]
MRQPCELVWRALSASRFARAERLLVPVAARLLERGCHSNAGPQSKERLQQCVLPHFHSPPSHCLLQLDSGSNGNDIYCCIS